MIRDFVYNPKASQIVEILQQFGFELSNEEFPFALLRFEILTPDSFMWRLLIDENIYYIYAEDYVSGLDYIKNVFDSYLEDHKWEFVIPSKAITFESASPVVGADIYQEPNDKAEMMKYAADSGHDFVFVIKSSENAGDAQFSDHASRGFNLN